eukprot:5511348-Amphidinium_carterae.1
MISGKHCRRRLRQRGERQSKNKTDSNRCGQRVRRLTGRDSVGQPKGRGAAYEPVLNVYRTWRWSHSRSVDSIVAITFANCT